MGHGIVLWLFLLSTMFDCVSVGFRDNEGREERMNVSE